jgi:predicted extracellular nuclease
MAGANIRVGLLFDPAGDFFRSGQRRTGGQHRHPLQRRRPQLTLNPGRIAPAHPAFAGDSRHHWAPSRKTLAAEFEVDGRRLFVIVCHFKSMRSISRREEDYAKKQRHAQAEIVHDFAADLLACDPQAAIVVLGDLNDVPGSKTLKLLKGESVPQSAGRSTARARLHPAAWRPTASSGSHSGQSGAAPGATARIPHVNSDATPGKPEPASDHDPVVALLPRH